MGNKIFRKGIVAVGMGLVLLSETPSAVLANVPEQIQPMTVYISDCNAELSISEKGVALVKVDVTSKGGSSTSINAILQKKTSDGWKDTKTWKVEGQGGYTLLSKTYLVSKGTYRVYATVKAGTETKHPVSATKTY